MFIKAVHDAIPSAMITMIDTGFLYSAVTLVDVVTGNRVGESAPSWVYFLLTIFVVRMVAAGLVEIHQKRSADKEPKPIDRKKKNPDGRYIETADGEYLYVEESDN